MKTKKAKYLVPLIFLVVFLLAILFSLLVRHYTQVPKVDNELTDIEEIEDYLQLISEENKISPELVVITDEINVPEINNNLDEIKQDLSDPELLVSFLNKNFDLSIETAFVAKDPQEFFASKTGNGLDVAVFSAQILYPEISITGVIRYDYLSQDNEKKSHFVAVFRDSQSPKYLTLNQLGKVEIYSYGRSFIDLIRHEQERLNVKISRYAHFPRNSLDLSEVIEPFSWQYLD
jgi:hypothetical protein